MKQVLRITLASLLSLVILISGTGFTFGKISCNDCGIAFDYKEIEDCCDEEPAHDEATFSCGCCDIINVDLRTDEFYAGKYVVDTQPPVSHIPFSFFDNRFLKISALKENIPLPDVPSPPPGGREFLEHTPHLLI